MKKVLEDELMSLAHRILKLKNRADIHELKEQSAVLYEKLSILSFAEKHFEGLKPTIKKYDVEKSIEKEYINEQENLDYPDGTEYSEDQIYEHNTEKIKDIVSQMPYESGQVDDLFGNQKDDSEPDLKDKTKPKPQDDVQDFGVHFDDLPDFEPARDESEEDNEKKNEPKSNVEQEAKDNLSQKDADEDKDKEKPKRTMDLFSQPKKSLNDSLNKELKIGLNDRLSFVNHLFKGDTKAYEKFIKEIDVLDNFEAVKSYLDQQIQDKYSYWKDKEDLANRLLHLIEKKFE